MRRLSRRQASFVVYIGAWLASMELATELFFAEWPWTPPAFFIPAARALQIFGLVVALVGAYLLRYPPEPEAPEVAALDPVLHAGEVMSAYYREVTAHVLGAGLMLSVAAAYAAVLYVRLLSTLPAALYYLVVLCGIYAALLVAWGVPLVGLMREGKRVRDAAKA